MRKLKFYSDAGHGWLAVPRSKLHSLNILDKISEYSYQSKSGKTVYLEEDCDATLFLRTIEQLNQEVSLLDVDHGDKSWIRNMPRFKR